MIFFFSIHTSSQILHRFAVFLEINTVSGCACCIIQFISVSQISTQSVVCSSTYHWTCYLIYHVYSYQPNIAEECAGSLFSFLSVVEFWTWKWYLFLPLSLVIIVIMKTFKLFVELILISLDNKVELIKNKCIQPISQQLHIGFG